MPIGMEFKMSFVGKVFNFISSSSDGSELNWKIDIFRSHRLECRSKLTLFICFSFSRRSPLPPFNELSKIRRANWHRYVFQVLPFFFRLSLQKVSFPCPLFNCRISKLGLSFNYLGSGKKSENVKIQMTVWLSGDVWTSAHRFGLQSWQGRQ